MKVQGFLTKSYKKKIRRYTCMYTLATVGGVASDGLM